MSKAPKWTVTRQAQWINAGKYVVEISSGGLDYSNPDALCKAYPGEFEEFNDPREAVEAAIKIGRAWRDDQRKLPRNKQKTIHIDHGATGGNTMPFDGMYLTQATFNALRKWAVEVWEKLDKCEQCGELMGDERYGNSDFGEYDCCSEFCAEKRWFTPDEDEDIIHEDDDTLEAMCRD